jgi:hypothetical protein
MKVLVVVFELLLIVGGVVAMSGLIVAKKPDAKAMLDKLVPFQALIGVGLLLLAVIVFIASGPGALFHNIKPNPVPAMAMLAGILGGIVLGVLFGLPQLASAGGSLAAAQRAQELSQKIAPFQALIGIVAAGAGVVTLLYTLGIMKLAGSVGLDNGG